MLELAQLEVVQLGGRGLALLAAVEGREEVDCGLVGVVGTGLHLFEL